MLANMTNSRLQLSVVSQPVDKCCSWFARSCIFSTFRSCRESSNFKLNRMVFFIPVSNRKFSFFPFTSAAITIKLFTREKVAFSLFLLVSNILNLPCAWKDSAILKKNRDRRIFLNIFEYEIAYGKYYKIKRWQ